MTAPVRKEGETPYFRLLATLPCPGRREFLHQNLLRVESVPRERRFASILLPPLASKITVEKC